MVLFCIKQSSDNAVLHHHSYVSFIWNTYVLATFHSQFDGNLILLLVFIGSDCNSVNPMDQLQVFLELYPCFLQRKEREPSLINLNQKRKNIREKRDSFFAFYTRLQVYNQCIIPTPKFSSPLKQYRSNPEIPPC